MCAWDKSKPTNSEKIRELGEVIRPNWDAIESADSTFKPEALNLADRTPLGVANDPTVLASTVITYSKQDGAGAPQLYAIDPSSNVIQLTAGAPTAAASGSSNLPGGVIIKWGSGAATSVAGGATINFASAFPNNCWHVVVTPFDPNANYASVVSKNVNSFNVRSNNAVTVSYIAIGN